MKNNTITSSPIFPYALNDLIGWVVKRKDGTVARYNISPGSINSGAGAGAGAGYKGNHYGGGYKKHTPPSLSQFCDHNPVGDPIFETDDVRLWIADSNGVRKHGGGFDMLIDCANLVSLTKPSAVLSGNSALRDALTEHTIPEHQPEILRIAWDDRAAPPVVPEFWSALASQLKGDVCINCMGGHGRSGTALTALMMVLNPEYGSKEAIVHLRALHCPRAIESKDQHEHLDQVATHLGRAANSKDLEGVKSYRQTFLSLTLKSARPYQERLKTAPSKVEVEKDEDWDYYPGQGLLGM